TSFGLVGALGALVGGGSAARGGGKAGGISRGKSLGKVPRREAASFRSGLGAASRADGALPPGVRLGDAGSTEGAGAGTIAAGKAGAGSPGGLAVTTGTGGVT